MNDPVQPALSPVADDKDVDIVLPAVTLGAIFLKILLIAAGLAVGGVIGLVAALVSGLISFNFRC